MKAGSETLKGVLRGGGFSTRLLVDSFYGATRTAEGLGAGSWNLEWDSEARIKSGGTLTITHSSESGETMVPRAFTDTLAVAGQEVSLALEVSTDGGFSESVQLGIFRITAVPSSSESIVNVLGQEKVVSSTVTLTLEDRLVALDRKGFRSEQNPPVGAKCWNEIARLSGMQVIRNMPEKSVPSGVQYLAQRGGVLDAIQDIANSLGGVPFVNPEGALSVLPDERGPVVADLQVGDEGTIIDLTDTMESEGIVNTVIGNFETDERAPIFAVADVRQGPFSVNSPYGEYVRYYDSDFVKNQAQANAAVKAILTQAQSGQSYRVPVQCLVNPLIDDGDTVSVERQSGPPIVGRVVSHRLGSSNLMDLELDVLRELT